MPTFVVLLLLLTHHFRGVKTDSMPRNKRDVLRPKPHIAPPFLCPLGHAATKLVPWLNTSRLLWEWKLELCCASWKSGICSQVPSGRAALRKWEQGCHLLLVLVRVTFSVCCRALCDSQQLEVFPAVMTAALGRHCLFVEKIRRHLVK